MKLSSIYNKKKTKVVNSKIEKIEKKQLEAFIGGGNGDSSTPILVDTVRQKSHSNTTN